LEEVMEISRANWVNVRKATSANDNAPMEEFALAA